MADSRKRVAEKKAAKAAYDREYRQKNLAKRKAQSAAWFRRTYDPVKAAIERKKNMPRHVEYCRQPEYRAYKKSYDRKRRAGKFGPFAEAYEVLLLLMSEIKRQMPDRFERYAQAGRHQWNPINQIRRRMKLDGRNKSYSSELERCTLVNP